MSLRIEDWGLAEGLDGGLVVDGCSTSSVAETYGTPVHVVHERRLRDSVGEYIRAFRERYPAEVLPCYALKCNGVPAVVEMILQSGAKPEVMSEYEYWLARRLGAAPGDIVVNGPHKSKRFLERLVSDGVGLVVVDSMFELERLSEVCADLGQEAKLLLRLNPDFVPKGMSASTAAASRSGSVFGLDMKEDEHSIAFDLCRRDPFLRFQGVHVHIGTGCKIAADYARVFELIGPALLAARERGLETRWLDFGGGYGSATAREFTSLEFLRYIGFGRLPSPPEPGRQATFAEFAERISGAVESFCGRHRLPIPSLILEPGRALVSSNIFLLLSVLDVEPPRRGVSLAVTDGGRWTTTLQPTYEYHEIFLCNDPSAPRSARYTIAGIHAFGGDIITRNRLLPPLEAGDVLAVMDSGAYFTSMESNFGHPRPPYVAVRNGEARLVRRREEPEDMLARDAAAPS